MATHRASIVSVSARQILDSRGRPTVEAEVVLRDGSAGRACVPSGASTGRHEAFELRDGDAAAYAGLGVSRAVAHVRGEIAVRLKGMDARDQHACDQAMIALDGSARLERLGANAVLGVSLALCRAAAAQARLPLYRHIGALCGAKAGPSLPLPMTNILSGGAHAGAGMDFQDFLAVPVGAGSYGEALSHISRVRAAAAEIMGARGLTVLLADEGGLSPGFAKAEQALELMLESFERAGLRPGEDMAIALDVAASELWRDGSYRLDKLGARLTTPEMSDYVLGLARAYPIVSVEDPLDQDDWAGWEALARAAPEIQIVGDDLFATSPARISEGIRRGVANAALIKLNQNGTLTGTLDAVAVTRRAGYAPVVSARSGETEDSFIADLAVAVDAGQIKIGSVRGAERLSKYNRLLRIEEDGLAYAGRDALAGSAIRRGQDLFGGAPAAGAGRAMSGHHER